MKLRAKVAIFLIALFVSFAGFNLMTSSTAVEMMKFDKKVGYSTSNSLAHEITVTAEFQTRV